jgi:pyruvate/2-oxoglutarate/acetoin dehydrogenase E1 component
MTYRDALSASMDALAADPAAVFIGYGLTVGRAMGTMRNVSTSQIIETPVAEGLMASVAIGQSLAGKKPLVFFERMDFIWNAADAIVNHLDAMALISEGEFQPAVILRCVIGNRTKPLFTGYTHTRDFGEALEQMVSFPVIRLSTPEMVAPAYTLAQWRQGLGGSTMLIEYKDKI